MAIGSEPEVGSNFSIWKDMSESDRLAWWDYMRHNWNPLMKGYATLVHNKNNPYYRSNQMNTEPENIEEEKEEPKIPSIIESVNFIVDMMNSGKADPKQVYPPNRYHGD